MNWLSWTLVTIFTLGIWGVLARRLTDAMDWRLVAGLSLVGYALVLATLWFFASPDLGQLTWESGSKAIAVGVLAQTAVLMFYKALDSGGKAVTVVPITALYPAVSLFGALLFLDESVRPLQMLGVLLSIVAAALIASGPD